MKEDKKLENGSEVQQTKTEILVSPHHYGGTVYGESCAPGTNTIVRNGERITVASGKL